MFKYFSFLVALTLIFLICSCSRKKGKISSRDLITEISVRKIKIPGETGIISENFIKNHIEKIMEKSDIFPYKKGAKTTRPWAMEIKFFIREVSAVRSRLVEGQLHDRATETGVEIMLRPLFKNEKVEPFSGISEKYVTFSKINPGDLNKKLQNSLKENLNSAMEKILTDSALVRATDEEIIKNLKNTEPAKRLSSLAIVGRRGLKRATPELIEMLRTEKDMAVKLRIAGVLGVLKDEKAVEPLSELALTSSEEHAVVLMNVLANIGGKRAVTFLRWMESSHHSRTVRKGAENILIRLNLK